MPKMSRIQLINQFEQPVLTFRTYTSVQKLPQLIGTNFQQIITYLQQTEGWITDAPFVLYHNMDMHNLDVEMGFPISQLVPAQGEMKARTLPAGRAIFCMDRGPYPEMAPLYEEMAQWIPANGFQASGTVFEYYYNDPEFPESEYLTKIVMPLL